MYIWGKGRAAGRVRLFVSNRGSGRVNVSPGWVKEKWPMDNYDLHRANDEYSAAVFGHNYNLSPCCVWS